MAEAPRDLGPAHLLSWVNSGPPEMSEADRTIHQLLYLDAAGGPVIHTPVQKGLDGWGPGVTGWFAAPRGLLDTLVELGAPVSGAAVVEQGSVPRAGSAPQQSDGVLRGAFWYLGIAGLVAFGVVTALRARRPAALGKGRIDP
jgi:hypothetical protein